MIFVNHEPDISQFRGKNGQLQEIGTTAHQIMSAQSPGDLEDADSSRSAAVTSAQMGAGRRDVQEATKSKGPQRDRPTAQGRSNGNMIRAPIPPQSAQVREEGRVKWHVGCGAIGNSRVTHHIARTAEQLVYVQDPVHRSGVNGDAGPRYEESKSQAGRRSSLTSGCGPPRLVLEWHVQKPKKFSSSALKYTGSSEVGLSLPNTRGHTVICPKLYTIPVPLHHGPSLHRLE